MLESSVGVEYATAAVFLIAGIILLYALYYKLVVCKPTSLFYGPDSIHKEHLSSYRRLKSFSPSFLLINPHLQTVGSKLLRRTPRLEFIREHVPVDDGGEVGIDWEASCYALPPTAPTVLVLHGLVGSSNSKYVRHTVATLRHHKWRSVVLNARGCGSTRLKTPRMFNASSTADLHRTATHLKKKFPDSPLFVIAYSLGSNILCRYLGNIGKSKEDSQEMDGEKAKTAPAQSPFVAAVCISNPFDLVHTLAHGARGLQFYSRVLTIDLVNYMKKHRGLFEEDYDVNHILQSRLVQDFDERCVIKMFNYETIHDYYTEASSHSLIGDIPIPMLFLNSKDDPISPHAAVPVKMAEKNPNLLFGITERGGHIAYLQNFRFWSTSWADHVSLEFLDVMLSRYQQQAPQT